jgi:hypothetical protein
MLRIYLCLKYVARKFINMLFHTKVIVNILSLVQTHNMLRPYPTSLIWNINCRITNYTEFSEKYENKFILIFMYTLQKDIKWYIWIFHLLTIDIYVLATVTPGLVSRRRRNLCLGSVDGSLLHVGVCRNYLQAGCLLRGPHRYKSLGVRKGL